jgi:hypothetical protein
MGGVTLRFGRLVETPLAAIVAQFRHGARIIGRGEISGRRKI